jgi:hypothetical protein
MGILTKFAAALLSLAGVARATTLADCTDVLKGQGLEPREDADLTVGIPDAMFPVTFNAAAVLKMHPAHSNGPDGALGADLDSENGVEVTLETQAGGPCQIGSTANFTNHFAGVDACTFHSTLSVRDEADRRLTDEADL